MEWIRCLIGPQRPTWLRIDPGKEKRVLRWIDALLVTMAIAIVVLSAIADVRLHSYFFLRSHPVTIQLPTT